MNPKISLITPVYNGEIYLSRCVESIIKAANGYNIELIIIDDGSTDSSGEIGREYATRFDWIHYIFQQNKGPSSARNAGLDLIKGDYVGFIDCDDSIAPTYLEKLLSSLAENPDIIVFGYEKKLLNGESNFFSPKATHHENSEELLVNVNNDRELFWFSWTKLFCANLLQHIRFNEKIKLGEDTIFNIQAVAKANFIIRIPEVLYSYYETQGSLSSAKYKPSLLQNMEKHFEGRVLVHQQSAEGLSKRAQRDISIYYLGHIVPWLLSNTMQLDKGLQLNELIKIRNSKFVNTCFEWSTKTEGNRGQIVILMLFKFRQLRLLQLLLNAIRKE